MKEEGLVWCILTQWFSERGSRISSNSILWELVSNSQALPHTSWIRNSWGGVQPSIFTSPGDDSNACSNLRTTVLRGFFTSISKHVLLLSHIAAGTSGIRVYKWRLGLGISMGKAWCGGRWRAASFSPHRSLETSSGEPLSRGQDCRDTGRTWLRGPWPYRDEVIIAGVPAYGTAQEPLKRYATT